MDRPKEDLGNAQAMQDGYATGDQSQLIDGAVSGERINSEMSPLQMEQQAHKLTSEGLKVIIISSITFAISVTVALVLTIYLAPPPVSPHAGVAADDEICSNIGLDVLTKKGSAVDSAIASMLCVGVVSPHHSGIGGGGFMIIRLHKNDETVVIDFRETAPNSSTPDMFKSNPRARYSGGLSVAVPGELRGLEAAHKKYGKLSWRELVKPAADLARSGFNVSQSLASHIKKYINASEDTDLVKIFYREGQPLATGDFLKRPDLAEVLDTVAENGADAIYSGKYTQDIVDTVNKNGGKFTIKDLKQYAIVQGEPVSTILDEYVVETTSAPTGGPLLLLMLNIMNGYQLNKTDPLYYHRLVETIKIAYGHGDQLADPSFKPMTSLVEKLTNTTFADEMRGMIDDNFTHSDPAYYMTGGGVPSSSGTAHVSVIGPHEDLVSITSTVNLPFGSKLVTDSGIILNNEMGDFSTETINPSVAVNMNNLPEPGKRPLSYTCPVVIHKVNKNCGERMAIGGINGSRIISGVAEVILDHFIFGNSLNFSVERPRIHNPLSPDHIEYESGIGQDVIDYLKKVGHTSFEELEALNMVNAVLKINETVYAHSDSRLGGKAAYY